jgi:hypothetical protein
VDEECIAASLKLRVVRILGRDSESRPLVDRRLGLIAEHAAHGAMSRDWDSFIFRYAVATLHESMKFTHEEPRPSKTPKENWTAFSKKRNACYPRVDLEAESKQASRRLGTCVVSTN